jgi:hypothetical protein
MQTITRNKLKYIVLVKYVVHLPIMDRKFRISFLIGLGRQISVLPVAILVPVSAYVG